MTEAETVEKLAIELWYELQKDWPERVKEDWHAPDCLGIAVKQLKRDYQRKLARVAMAKLRELGWRAP